MEYELEYYENLLRQYSKTAEEICKVRWEWFAELTPRSVLDYGSGVGWFRAFRPSGIEVDSYDVGPFPQTGLKLRVYDVVCLYDVLEHIPDFGILEPIIRLTDHIVVSLPIKNGDLSTWKHFKPGEHLHYFTHETLQALFKRYGFSAIKWGTPECPPRKDIYSYLFGRISAQDTTKTAIQSR